MEEELYKLKEANFDGKSRLKGKKKGSECWNEEYVEFLMKRGSFVD